MNFAERNYYSLRKNIGTRRYTRSSGIFVIGACEGRFYGERKMRLTLGTVLHIPTLLSSGVSRFSWLITYSYTSLVGSILF